MPIVPVRLQDEVTGGLIVWVLVEVVRPRLKNWYGSLSRAHAVSRIDSLQAEMKQMGEMKVDAGLLVAALSVRLFACLMFLVLALWLLLTKQQGTTLLKAIVDLLSIIMGYVGLGFALTSAYSGFKLASRIRFYAGYCKDSEDLIRKLRGKWDITEGEPTHNGSEH